MNRFTRPIFFAILLLPLVVLCAQAPAPIANPTVQAKMFVGYIGTAGATGDSRKDSGGLENIMQSNLTDASSRDFVVTIRDILEVIKKYSNLVAVSRVRSNFGLLTTTDGPSLNKVASRGNVTSKLTRECLPTDGNQPTDGTQTWQPTCYGAWLDQDPNAFHIFATRGTLQVAGTLVTTAGSTSASFSGLPSSIILSPGSTILNGAYLEPQTIIQAVSGSALILSKPAIGSGAIPVIFIISNMVTGNLIQSWADGNSQNAANAFAINFESVGGNVSAGSNPQNNAVALFTSVRQRPDAAGRTPPLTWGLNTDFHIAPNSGNVQSYLFEADLNNFNKTCGIGSGCLSAWIWFNGISAASNTAMLYAGGATVTTFSGNGTTSGNIITVADFKGGTPQAFSPDLAYVVVDSIKYHATYIDATHAMTTRALPTHVLPFPFTASIAQSHFGYFINGYEQVLEADIRLADAATWGLQLYGDHAVGIDTTADKTPRALQMGAGQTACWDSANSCLQYLSSPNIFQYRNGSITPWYVTLNDVTMHARNITVDGAGILRFGTFIETTCANAGYIAIQDTFGTTRKVMICN